MAMKLAMRKSASRIAVFLFALAVLTVLATTSASAHRSVPTAASKATSVAQSQRQAVLFVADLSSGATGLEKGFYQFVTFAAVALGQTFLPSHYNEVTVVQGPAATLGGLVSALAGATSHSNILAVDLVFVTHGLSNQVEFADGLKSMTTVQNAITSGLSSAQRAKLRVVFSTACFGATHRAAWIAAGFKAASGSLGIYADSATSYPTFLHSWWQGETFGQAVNDANQVDALFHVNDNLAKTYFNTQGNATFANQVNSTRVTSGNTGLTLASSPTG
jgi:hypothetical protein